MDNANPFNFVDDDDGMGFASDKLVDDILGDSSIDAAACEEGADEDERRHIDASLVPPAWRESVQIESLRKRKFVCADRTDAVLQALEVGCRAIALCPAAPEKATAARAKRATHPPESYVGQTERDRVMAAAFQVVVRLGKQFHPEQPLPHLLLADESLAAFQVLFWSSRSDFASLRLATPADEACPAHRKDVGTGRGMQLHPPAPPMSRVSDPTLRAQHLLAVSARMPHLGIRVMVSLAPVVPAFVEQAAEIVGEPIIWAGPRLQSPLPPTGTLKADMLTKDALGMEEFKLMLPDFFPLFMPLAFRRAIAGDSELGDTDSTTEE